MEEQQEKISELLHQAGETHHAVYHKEEGNDPDWATWYSDWLVNHSDLPEILGQDIVRSKLTALLVRFDNEYSAEERDAQWPAWYAEQLISSSEELKK